MRTKNSGVARSLVPGLIGVAAGILTGSRLIKTYDWRTDWHIPAPLPLVYAAVISREALRQWWPSMELADETGDDALRVGSSVSFRVHQAPEVARLAPPFHIHCVYTDVESEQRLREAVTGDLTGVLEILFRESPGGGGTRVTFNWYVRVTNPALNLLGYVTERMYRHSHDSVMREGEEGLRRYCAGKAGPSTNGRDATEDQPRPALADS